MQAVTAAIKIPPGPTAVAIALIPPIMPLEPVISAIRPFIKLATVVILPAILDASPAIFAAANAPIRAAPNASIIN